jgi:streptogramin lyase
MATHLSTRRSPSRYSLLLASLVILVGILGGCGASSTAGPSLPSGSTSTSTPTLKLKGTIDEFSLPDPDFRPGDITAGPDGNLWFTEDTSNHTEKGKIGRITLTGNISELPLPTPSGGPGEIAVGPDGKLWFTEMLSNKIGRLV